MLLTTITPGELGELGLLNGWGGDIRGRRGGQRGGGEHEVPTLELTLIGREYPHLHPEWPRRLKRFLGLPESMDQGGRGLEIGNRESQCRLQSAGRRTTSIRSGRADSSRHSGAKGTFQRKRMERLYKYAFPLRHCSGVWLREEESANRAWKYSGFTAGMRASSLLMSFPNFIILIDSD